MTTIALPELVTALSSDEVLASELSTAASLGLTTTTWQSGDPTRTTLEIMARLLSPWTEVAVRAIGGGLLDYATGGWLTLLAENGYGVTREAAVYATCPVTLTNAGGGVYTFAAGDLVVSASGSGATYRNTTGGTLNALGTLALDVQADVAGTGGSAAPGDIDTITSPAIGSSVTVANTDAAIGTDEESDAALRLRCRESLAAISPDGAAAAYDYVARSATRVDGTAIGITRTRVTGGTGTVSLVIADDGGAPAGADVTRVDDLIQTQVVPVGVTATVTAATGVPIAIVYTAYVPTTTTDTDGEIETAVQDALEAWLPTVPIGGSRITSPGTGYVWHDRLRGVIAGAHEAIYHVTLSTPAADTALADDEVATLGTITPTITRVDQL